MDEIVETSIYNWAGGDLAEDRESTGDGIPLLKRPGRGRGRRGWKEGGFEENCGEWGRGGVDGGRKEGRRVLTFPRFDPFSDKMDVQSPSSKQHKSFERLIQHFLPVAPELFSRYLNYFTRLLGSRLDPLVSRTDESVMDLMLKRAKTTQDARRLQELVIRLRRGKSLSQRWSVLYLLSRLDDSNASSAASTGPLALLPPSSKPKPASPTEIKEKDDGVLIREPTQRLAEADILRSLLFAMQNINSAHITFSDLEDAFIIQPNLELSDSVRRLVSELCEMGWLYRNIVKYADENSDDGGLVVQSFCSALRKELTEYYRLLALLEQQKEEFQGAFSLRKLYLWCAEPMERLKWLQVLVESVQGLKGGALASAVYVLSRQGNPTIKSCIHRVLDEVSKPLLEMLKHWMLDGDLTDPSKEFFIYSDFSVPSDQLWTEKYKIEHAMVPAFFNTSLLQRVLVTGKSINFIRTCCEEEDWVMRAELPSLTQLTDYDTLEKWVDEAAKVTNAELIRILFTKYKFKGHCNSIRKYLLLGQGDFHHHLMGMMYEELNESARNIMRHNLISIVEGAIRVSNAQFDDLEFVGRLDVKLLEASQGDRGWDVFSLNYRVDLPISTLFTPPMMEKFFQVFKFLWHVKRVDFRLKAFKHTHEMLALMSMADVRIFLHRAQILRHEISHFVTTLMSYLMVEVIDAAWKRFSDSLAEAKDLDSLMTMLKKFLESIMERAFLTGKMDSIHKELLKLLDLALRFSHTQDTLLDSAIDEYHHRETITNERQIREALSSSDPSLAQDVSRLSKEAILDMQQISEHFVESLSSFRRLLVSNQKTYLHFFALRLDFNEYYTKIEEKREDIVFKVKDPVKYVKPEDK